MSDDKAILDADRNVIPATLQQWGMWLEDNNGTRKVAVDTVGKIRISTVFIGLNHGSEDDPLWFETMIFGGKEDGWQQRYATWDEAASGHAAVVAKVSQADGGAS